jgi:hypothetical protein
VWDAAIAGSQRRSAGKPNGAGGKGNGKRVRLQRRAGAPA